MNVFDNHKTPKNSKKQDCFVYVHGPRGEKCKGSNSKKIRPQCACTRWPFRGCDITDLTFFYPFSALFGREKMTNDMRGKVGVLSHKRPASQSW